MTKKNGRQTSEDLKDGSGVPFTADALPDEDHFPGCDCVHTALLCRPPGGESISVSSALLSLWQRSYAEVGGRRCASICCECRG